MTKVLYRQLAEQITSDYAHASGLPSERALAEHYACTRSTIRAALKEIGGKGNLESHSRHGHQLLGAGTAVPGGSGKLWNIVMLAGRNMLDDQQFMDFVAGAVCQAKLCNVNFIVREVGAEANAVATMDQFHSGILADGYLLAGCASERLCAFLENTFKPCVVLGEVLFDVPEKRRFLQVCLPQGEKYHFVFKRLMDLGHRRFLTASRSGGPVVAFAEQFCRENKNVSIDIVSVALSRDASIPTPGIGEKVVASLKDHTALVLPFGGATSLSVYQQLLAAGVDIPRRLSLVIDSGRYDYFVRVFGIDNIFSSAWDEGASCIVELERQLRTGELRFGCKMSHYQYIEGRTVMPLLKKKVNPENVYEKIFFHTH